MSTEVQVPVDVFRKAVQDFHTQQNHAINRMQDSHSVYSGMCEDLKYLPFVTFSYDTMGYGNLNFFGGKNEFKQVMTILYRFGFSARKFPQPGDTYWMEYVRRGDMALWVNFTSTKCIRKQVGTQMKEVPIYETVCEDEVPEYTPPPQLEGAA